ncbi:RNA polymerase sigma factor [Pseudarcicella hirudinis]
MSNSTEAKLTDSILWNAFRAGDEIAFGQIAEQYYRNLFSYGLKFSKDRELVKDCIQDLFMDLWYKRETLGDTEFVKFYLFKSLRRKIHKEILKNHWISEEDDLVFEAENIETRSVEQQIIELETNEFQIQQLKLHLDTLPKRQQEIIYLRFYENLDNEAIANVMSISRQAVANLLYRTIRELKDRL